MSEVARDNRRIHGRQVVSIPGSVARGSQESFGKIENLGSGGAFFSTTDLELSLDDGDTVTVTFDVLRRGARETVQKSGTVLRSERFFDGSSVVRALAVKFDELLVLDGIDFA